MSGGENTAATPAADSGITYSPAFAALEERYLALRGELAQLLVEPDVLLPHGIHNHSPAGSAYTGGW